jgi:uncharacterized protein YqgC (DUF456 family)
LWLESVVVVLSIATMVVGLFGLIIPIFPGNVIIWVAALVYGLVVGFGRVGAWLFVMITLLAIAGALTDNIMMAGKARQSGASWWSILVALLGGVIGTLVLPPIGGLIAAPLLLFGMEVYHHKDQDKAWKVTRGLLIGWGLAFIIRFIIGVFQIGLWVVWAFL